MLREMARPVGPPRFLLFTVAVALLTFFGGVGYANDDFEQIWFSKSQCDTTPRLAVNVVHPETASPHEPINFLVEIMATIPYQATLISMFVESEDQKIMHESVLNTDLHRGRNQAAFQWDASMLPPARYMMVVEVDYADTFPTAQCMLPFSKVSAVQWKRDLADAEKSLAALEEQFQKIPSAHRGGIQFQFNIINEAVLAAHTALRNQDWHTLDHRVAYLQQKIKTLHAGIVFGQSTQETSGPCAAPTLEHIEIRDGGLYADNCPVFLFGIALDNHADLHEQMRRINGYGLNFTVKTISVSDTPEGAGAVISKTLESAHASGIAVTVQFNQEDIAGEIMDQWPELLEAGFINMAHEAFGSLYAERLAALAVSLSGKPMVVCAAIAHAPQFKYDGEPVRKQFIARVQERYPDRIELNRLWRSHLAEYDEITIWGDPPEHGYQNRRAYQYEWQYFQRELITLFLARLEQELSQIAPDIPMTLTLSDGAFLPGETRYSVNREAAAIMMHLNGCAVTAGSDAELYAMNYPLPHASYTLMRSYAPGKPIINLRGDIDMVGLESPEERAALVRSALWEAVTSGLNALALPANSAVLEYPEALEAFATTARDINRLAPIVAEFQQAKPQIGILFSEASKIMDDGIPHLESAKFAFEGASFAGYAIHFITESQIEKGALNPIKVLILPETLAVSDATFEQLAKYVDGGGMVARVGTPIPYNERGHSRGDVIRSTSNTILVRGMNLPTEYLHAMDAAQVGGVLPETARPVNAFGYPLEGVRSRYVEHDGEGYLYIINLRKTPVNCYLTGVSDLGRDLIHDGDIEFPRILPPLEPMLIRMERRELGNTLARF